MQCAVHQVYLWHSNQISRSKLNIKYMTFQLNFQIKTEHQAYDIPIKVAPVQWSHLLPICNLRSKNIHVCKICSKSGQFFRTDLAIRLDVSKIWATAYGSANSIVSSFSAFLLDNMRSLTSCFSHFGDMPDVFSYCLYLGYKKKNTKLHDLKTFLKFWWIGKG